MIFVEALHAFHRAVLWEAIDKIDVHVSILGDTFKIWRQRCLQPIWLKPFLQSRYWILYCLWQRTLSFFILVHVQWEAYDSCHYADQLPAYDFLEFLLKHTLWKTLDGFSSRPYCCLQGEGRNHLTWMTTAKPQWKRYHFANPLSQKSVVTSDGGYFMDICTMSHHEPSPPLLLIRLERAGLR